MGLFGKQLSNVVEWEEYRDDLIFWKWTNDEIKKGSKLIIRPGQDAIFMFNGNVEGIFKDEGSFDIESEIIPFLSTLKGFKFGFNSGMRAEVLFINTKDFTVNWGTKNVINIHTPQLPGGMPIRANGKFSFKISDYMTLIDKVAGIKQVYSVADVKDRVIGDLDPLLMKWIVQEGKDMFNLQMNNLQISQGIKEDLDMQVEKIGLTVTDFNVNSFSYPEEIQRMANKAASQSMLGDVDKYTKIAMADSLEKGGSGAGQMAGQMAGLAAGMAMGQQMAGQFQNMGQQAGATGAVAGQAAAGQGPKFCPNCGTPTNGAKFCPNCGTQLS